MSKRVFWGVLLLLETAIAFHHLICICLRRLDTLGWEHHAHNGDSCTHDKEGFVGKSFGMTVVSWPVKKRNGSTSLCSQVRGNRSNTIQPNYPGATLLKLQTHMHKIRIQRETGYTSYE